MNKAFTMIEVIFVIVIIGILVAVAIPKLVASRIDAQAATIVNELTTCINTAGSRFMLTGSFQNFTQDSNVTSSCSKAKACFSFTEIDANGSLVVTNLSSSEKKCTIAQGIASKNLLSTTHTINF